MSLELSDKGSVIAEAGTCHASKDRVSTAIDYVHAAAECNADAVKFQMFHDPNPETMFCWIDGDEGRADRWKASVLDLDEWRYVKIEAESCGLMFLASPFEYETVKWQTELGVKATKVASRAAGHLEQFRSAPEPLLVSDGMYYVAPAENRIILQCEANYPSTTKWQGGNFGFSDHSGSPWMAIDAMARGCRLIEVHFYIHSSDAGPDYPASLTMDELKLVCEARDAL